MQARLRGFTLIEVLVALVVMSIMAVMTWQGVDGMARATKQHRERSDEIASMQTALAQWFVDLDHMIDDAQMPRLQSAGVAPQQSLAQAIEFDGRVLRVTRRFADDEMRVIAWGSRNVDTPTGLQRRFMRWMSEPVRTRGQWQAAWEQAQRWGQNPVDADRESEVQVLAIDEWQIFFYRGDAWSHALSADGSANLNKVMPDGVRLVLKLAATQVPGGTLSIDWVQPARGGGKS